MQRPTSPFTLSDGYVASSATTLADIMGKDDDDDNSLLMDTNNHNRDNNDHDEILPLTAFVESSNIAPSRRVLHGSSPLVERFRRFRADVREGRKNIEGKGLEYILGVSLCVGYLYFLHLTRNLFFFFLQNREFLAEFIGTLVLIVLLDGVSAEQTLNSTGPKSWLTCSFGTGKYNITITLIKI